MQKKNIDPEIELKDDEEEPSLPDLPDDGGVEIDSAVADGKHSVILPQVTFGIAVRMAVMSIVAGN